MAFEAVIDRVGQVMDGVGVAVIVVGALAATVQYLRTYRTATMPPAFRAYRQALGRAILLGLEFLVAGDIIRTEDHHMTLPAHVEPDQLCWSGGTTRVLGKDGPHDLRRWHADRQM